LKLLVNIIYASDFIRGQLAIVNPDFVKFAFDRGSYDEIGGIDAQGSFAAGSGDGCNAVQVELEAVFRKHAESCFYAANVKK